MKSIFDDAQTRLNEVFSHLELTDDVREKLQHPKLTVAFSIPTRMDNGSLEVFKGYRV